MFALRSMVLLLLVAAGGAQAQGWVDSFDSRSLDRRWEWRVPVPGPTYSLEERPGWLRVRIPEREGGYNHWNDPELVDDAPQLRTPAPPGDWELEARLQIHQLDAANHFQAGILAGVGDSLLLTLGPMQAPRLEDGPTAPEAWLEPTGLSGFCRVPGKARDLWLRLTRTGSLMRARISRDGQEWSEAGAYLLPPPRFIGLIGKTFGDGPAITFDVDYLRLTPLPGPEPPGRRICVGIGGEYPTGYRGILARLGLPYEVLLDYQLTDFDVLRRFELVVVGGLPLSVSDRAYEALTRYVREGGIAIVDFRAAPPAAVQAAEGGDIDTELLPDIVVGGEGNPLLPLLGEKTRFKPGESRYFFAPASLAGCQVLARWDGHPRLGAQARPAEGYTGTPAIWGMPLGRGYLVLSSVALGASLSWGPTQDALAEALLQCLGLGRLQPQLVPEGARLGRMELAPAEESDAFASAEPPPLVRKRPASSPGPLPRGARLIEEEPTPEFDLSGVYDPQRNRARLYLNYWSGRFAVNVLFTPERAELSCIRNGKVVQTAAVPLNGTAPVPFLVKERRDRVLLLAGGQHAAVTAAGLWPGRLAALGGALGSLRYQPVEPAYFGDDFARAEGEQGSWEAASGKWSLRALGDAQMGANPFTYSAQAEGVALATAGMPFWDDYAFAVSVRPTAGGMVGQAFYCQDEQNYLLFRARVSDNPQPVSGGLELVRVSGGQERVLARHDGCLVKGHWYRLTITARDGRISAAVDGQPAGTATENVLPGGKIGLYVREGQAEFDDVVVRPVAEAAAAATVELDGPVPRFAGTLDRDTWAGTALQWRADPETPGRFWRRGRFYGDFRLAFRCDFGTATAPAISLLLAPDSTAEGYRLTLRPAGSPTRAADGTPQRTYTVELAGPGTPATRTKVTAGEQPVLELRRSGSRVVALVEGRLVLQSRSAPTAGSFTRLGLLARGFRPRLSGLRLSAGSVLDYCFDQAPADWWVSSGTWDLAVRWPCTPKWSWFAGESRQVAAIWHKRSFTGDIALDLHVGPRTVDHGDGSPREICRAFNAVLCGDGQDVKSGYSIVVGANSHGAGATLSRNGEVVARNPDFGFHTDAHNQWINLRAEKRGAQISVWVGDQRILAWEDPNPLPGGRVGIWTQDNAIMIPRATLYHN